MCILDVKTGYRVYVITQPISENLSHGKQNCCSDVRVGANLVLTIYPLHWNFCHSF